MTKARGAVLLVDDEAYVRDSLAHVLQRKGYRVRTAATVADGSRSEMLAGLDVVVTDLKLPGEDGLDLVRAIAEREPALPVIVLTGHGTVSSAVACMRAGAVEYLLKPTDPEALILAIDRARSQRTVERELTYLRTGAGGVAAEREPLGVSAGWRRVRELASLAAPTDTSVLLLGESGTGKEEVAKLLHRESPRARRAFVSVNCAAIPSELFESEFFGHRRGAFTGAVADREGRFRVADGGTLFFDEIDALPLVAQAKVLRVLQDGAFERVGDSRSTRVDVRVVCASNTDLASAVEAGRFRPDLYYRINVMSISIPPLRDRRDDIPVLAEAFREELAPRLARPVRAIDPRAMAALVAYDWPGNVRELRNVIERGLLVERSEVLGPSSLPFNAGDGTGGDGGRDGEALAGWVGERLRDDHDLNLRASLASAERWLLETALTRAGGVRREAARMLGIDERNVAYYLKKHGLMKRGGR